MDACNETLTTAARPTLIPPRSLHLDAATLQVLLKQQGPSLGVWRAAEIAALREQTYEPPILDLGCGDGLVTSMVVPKVNIGIDPDP
ncbi:MAG TPA: class I SAM-dependent methyltransferase, partial [Chroococcales cyanobacterium]